MILFLAATICGLHSVSSFPSRAAKITQGLSGSGNIHSQTGKVKVPTLKGETIQQARRTLTEWHLLPGSVYGDDPKALICSA